MITIYYHSRCPHSRAALHALEQLCVRHDLLLELLDYHQMTFTLPMLRDLQKKLRLPVRAMVRCEDPKFLSLQLSDVSDAVLFEVLIAHPSLLQRPIVSYQHRAVIARPVELIDALFWVPGNRGARPAVKEFKLFIPALTGPHELWDSKSES